MGINVLRVRVVDDARNEGAARVTVRVITEMQSLPLSNALPVISLNCSGLNTITALKPLA